jgi:CRISPR-associated protein Cmx8
MKTEKNSSDQFEEKKGKLATDAFLAARSRPGREFARWFTSTLCSINQRLSDEEFVTLSTALEQQPDQVRSLTLLALSARG